jgi:agmatine deiminase
MEAFEILSKETDAKGRSLKVVKLQQPGPLYLTKEEAEGIDQTENGMNRQEGDRLAGSYCNFYIGNNCIVYPLLDEKYDAQTKMTLEELFPDKKVLGIPAREILLGGGNIHCITQQVPQFSH